MKTVFVLWWRYSDGSAAGVVRAYSDEVRAKQDMDLLNESFCSKDYEMVEVPLLAAA